MSMAITKHVSRMAPDAASSRRAYASLLYKAKRRFSSNRISDHVSDELAAEALKKAAKKVQNKGFWITMFDDSNAPSDAAWWSPEPIDGAELVWKINNGILDSICRDVLSEYVNRMKRQIRDTVPLEDSDDCIRMELTEIEKTILHLAEEVFHSFPAVEQGVVWTAPGKLTDYFADDRFCPEFSFTNCRLVKQDYENGIPYRVCLWAPTDSDKPTAPSSKSVDVKLRSKIWSKYHEQ